MPTMNKCSWGKKSRDVYLLHLPQQQNSLVLTLSPSHGLSWCSYPHLTLVSIYTKLLFQKCANAFQTLTWLTPSRLTANTPSSLVFLLLPSFRCACLLPVNPQSPWLAFPYVLISCLALKLGIYQFFSHYSSASSSKSQGRASLVAQW